MTWILTTKLQHTVKMIPKKPYKKIYSYQPGFAYVANPDTGQVMPVYIDEGRGGNSQAK